MTAFEVRQLLSSVRLPLDSEKALQAAIEAQRTASGAVFKREVTPAPGDRLTGIQPVRSDARGMKLIAERFLRRSLAQ